MLALPGSASKPRLAVVSLVVLPVFAIRYVAVARLKQNLADKETDTFQNPAEVRFPWNFRLFNQGNSMRSTES